MRESIEDSGLTLAKLRGFNDGELLVTLEDWETLAFLVLHLNDMIHDLHRQYYRVDDEEAREDEATSDQP